MTVVVRFDIQYLPGIYRLFLISTPHGVSAHDGPRFDGQDLSTFRLPLTSDSTHVFEDKLQNLELVWIAFAVNMGYGGPPCKLKGVPHEPEITHGGKQWHSVRAKKQTADIAKGC